VAAAKAFFLRFSNEKVLDETPYGHILGRAKTAGVARIYVKGLLVAEEQNFAFSLQHYVVDYDVIDRRLEVNQSEAKKVL
jgi:hypothetical protein